MDNDSVPDLPAKMFEPIDDLMEIVANIDELAQLKVNLLKKIANQLIRKLDVVTIERNTARSELIECHEKMHNMQIELNTLRSMQAMQQQSRAHSNESPIEKVREFFQSILNDRWKNR